MDIYLLAGVRGDTSEHAFTLAMKDTLRRRETLRRDLLARSLREIEKLTRTSTLGETAWLTAKP